MKNLLSRPTLSAAILVCSVFATMAQAAPPPPPLAPGATLQAREQRVSLLRDEMKAIDARIEGRIASLLGALQAVGDSKDSRTKVARMKERTIESLKKTIQYYQGRRATMVEELRRPTVQLTEEQKRKAITVFDEHIEKRVAQILAVQKSLPTHQDFDRYRETGSTWAGPTYVMNEDYKQNQRVTNYTNSQRREIEDGLRKSIARIEQQNRALKAQGAPAAAEIAKNDALLAERRKQLATALAPVETPTRAVGGKEANDLDQALKTATDELRRDFDALFAQYNGLLRELSALNAARSAAAAQPKAQ